MFTINSKKTHVNPFTGFSIPDESYFFTGHDLEEDEENYYAVRSYPTDGVARETFPKALWEVSI